MKMIYKNLWAVALVLGLAACDLSDFGDLNVNPNATTAPIATNLLTNAMHSLDNTITGTQGALYVQYWASSQYSSGDNYVTVQFDYNGWYNGPLMDLEKVIDLNTEEDTKVAASAGGPNENQIAVAKILQSYYYLYITDRWGDIPYSEALRADELILTPKFDTQQDVYTGIFQTLKDANNMMVAGDIEGDVIFDGDMSRWAQFANTIRMTAALRLSAVDATTGAAEFNSAISDGVISITDNSQNIGYQFLAEASFQNAWYARFLTRRDHCVSNTMVDFMQTTAFTDSNTGNTGMMDVAMDPRLPVYADPTENDPLLYHGMQYGISEARAGAISNSDVSFVGIGFQEQGRFQPVYTAAQVAFAMAEARELGWISSSTTQAYYEAGILASLTQYGVEADNDTYITNSAVAFNPATALQQIGRQKWLANYLNGYEAWADWRRTGFPALNAAEDALNTSGEIPVREAYPVTERDLNETNYNEVVARQGEDGLDTKVWWDAN